MIYLVTNNKHLFDCSTYEWCSVEYSIEYLSKLSIIGIDTETTGFSAHSDKILCLQLGDYNNQFVIDNTIDIKIYRHILEDASKLLLFQNAQFDLRFFIHYGFNIFKFNWKTFYFK